MKLLFDENVSPKLPSLLQNAFPSSQHVRDCGLKGKTDRELWEFAKKNDFIIVSKDSDFLQRSIVQGSPPKVVWLRIGNCSRSDVLNLIVSHATEIRDFQADATQSILVLR